MGADEISSNTALVKNLETGVQEKLALPDLVSYLA
jgi:hypothetical protein